MELHYELTHFDGEIPDNQ